MAKYEKWLGAGLGWVITGNPLGGLLGFLAGSVAGADGNSGAKEKTITDFEVNLMVIASHLIKTDGKVSIAEISFANKFMDAHFDEKFSVKRAQMLQHCLQHEYDLGAACGQLRNHTKHTTRLQVIQFLLELAASDGEVTQRENYFIFKIAGYLNINDVDFRRIKSGMGTGAAVTYVEVNMRYQVRRKRRRPLAQIRTAYRQLVLKYHPDRNNHLNEADKKQLAIKLQQIREAYEHIKRERGE